MKAEILTEGDVIIRLAELKQLYDNLIRYKKALTAIHNMHKGIIPKTPKTVAANMAAAAAKALWP